MDKLSFSQYLQSKQALLKAVDNHPIIEVSYIATKYCKINVLNEGQQVQQISIKPKNTINVTWQYQHNNTQDKHDINQMSRSPIKVEIVNEEDDSVNNITYSIDVPDHRFTKWLRTNTKVKI